MNKSPPPTVDVEKILKLNTSACAYFFKNGTLDKNKSESELWAAITSNHNYNMRLWAEEDLARREDAPDNIIVANKRNIDRYNQARNDAIERIDDILSDIFFKGGQYGRLNSETPGSMIDRLSIASLKLYHMTLQTTRFDVSTEHRNTCQIKLRRIIEQRNDLKNCLEVFIDECIKQAAHFKTYRQFKMYNDPELNMAVVRERQKRSPD